MSVQTVPRHASWLLLGPEAATSLVPQQDITVTFSDSSSVVIPAGIPAALPGGGTTWDRTQEVVVGYIQHGAGTLLASPESQLAALSGDYAPLVRVLADSVQVYQPQQPGGQPDVSGAWSGGAFISSSRAILGGGLYGVLASQSILGGGSVSGVPFSFGTNAGACTGGGFYMKAPSAPGSSQTLFDLNFGAPGYLRLKLTSALHVIFEIAVNCTPLTIDLTPSHAVPTGEWCWVTFGQYQVDANPLGGGFDHRYIAYGGAVYIPGGTSPDGTQSNYSNWNIFTPSSVAVVNTLSGVLGWGVATSDSTAGNPNSGTWELSKLQLRNAAPSTLQLLSPALSDASGGTALYLCRQTVGPLSGTLTDSSGNAYNLTPGGAGCTIVADGPYV